MRSRLMTAALAAAMLAGAVPPAAAQAPGLEGLVEDAREGVPVPEDGYAAEDWEEWFSDEELDELVAPVALYPDALLAQVLVASTFPLQIVKADRILDRSEEMSDDELAAELDAQDWDPSVLVLLSGFPTLIQRMADDLEQTEQLGLAMAEQDADVLAAVQRMRARAEETGWLESNEAQVVEREDDQIYIEPADPEVVYVPEYDPYAAFTSAPTAPPVIVQPRSGGVPSMLQNPLVAGAIGFGSALLVSELFGGDDDDRDEDGWDDYWHGSRPIAWRDREFYPRPYRTWTDRDARSRIAWSQERNRYWDRQANRWRREAEQTRRAAWRERREVRAWDVRRDPETGAARVRPRDWRDAETRLERRQAVERQRARRENVAAREAAAQRRERAELRDRREAAEQRRARAEQRERREAAAQRQERAKLQDRREAAEQRRARAELRERRAAEQRRARREDTAAREAAERREAAEQRRKRAERRAAAEQRQARAERREQAAERQQVQERRQQAAERQAALERRQRAAAERQQQVRRQQAERRARAERRAEAAAREPPRRRAQRQDCRDAGNAQQRRACRQGR